MTLPALPDNCWPVDTSCVLNWDEYDTETQDRAISLATSSLRSLSGYRVGGCPRTVRPCRAGCSSTTWGYWSGGTWMPYISLGGQWVNSACGCGTDNCSCTVVCEVNLPGPVGMIEQVTVNGAVIPPEWYRVDNSSKLVWVGDGTDMECGWPLCQDMTAPLDSTEHDTFGVTYLQGVPVDGLGAYAAGVLAGEFAKACSGSACRLPSGTTAIARQGVSFVIESPAGFPGGLTGIPEVDSWLHIVNPNKMKAPSSVWFPGQATGRTTTWSA